MYQVPMYRVKKEEVKTIVFRYIFICFFSLAPHDVKLASCFRVRRHLRLGGLSPQSIDMPVMLKKRGENNIPRFLNELIFL